ncbi:unnamed protein product [Adineta steineri]|uniref:CCHC-type domain-containing protein n=1 Tax=Adineta steineri TaxID=433720 RepID=A0A819UWP6_9BILA|nr:unnamed protein product [Adineta steineri]CAF4099513.1 unnamed protein product [Adineta steineri]
MVLLASDQVESKDATDPQSTTQIIIGDSNDNSSSLTKAIIEDKLPALAEYTITERDDKPSLLEVFRHHVKSFNGSDDARLWLKHIQSKFMEFNLTFDERFELIPYFFEDDVFIWYTLNQDKFQSYAHLCQLFIQEYIKFNREQIQDRVVNASCEQIPARVVNAHREQTPDHVVNASCEQIPDRVVNTNGEQINESSALHPLVVVNANREQINDLSKTIAKALIDKFIKDPLKFYGGKDNVTTWIDEIEQQFNIMHLNDNEKLKLIHICLAGEALQWYKQHNFTCWTIFIDEIRKSFTSNLQRDMAFDKLKKYHQTIHQSVTQYYVEMMKIMKQADPQMNESTQVRYLMNGLRQSLSTETRRNYPANPEAFLSQAKIAEELTTLNNAFTGGSINNNELTASNSYSNINGSTIKNQFNDYRRDANDKNHYYNNNTNYSPHNDNNQHGYLNQISKSSFFNSSRQVNSVKSPQKIPSSSYNYNNNYNTHKNNRFQQQSQSYKCCFNCGSANHLARYCHHFGNRSQ